MIKIELVIPWVPVKVPEHLQSVFKTSYLEKRIDISIDVDIKLLESLSKEYDIAFMHMSNNQLALAIDLKGKKFRQR